MIQKIKKLKSGFVILFAVTLSALLLSIAIGVTNIAFKELRFGTNARDTNDAFFAADTGIECALIYDKSTTGLFVHNPPISSSFSITCNNRPITVTENSTSYWTFHVPGLGSTTQSCAIVTVDKTDPGDSTTVPVFVITSKGYNTGSQNNNFCNPPTNAVERQLEVRY
ncbi:hypothetical protein A2643_01835 [Candidatus Nomurabacteria bacterium RIFCSPHIGHO2_01_FULL_39_220]|uniref:Type 4 fimbrial biogenesis protein PilX N-terminal domain-containing protein n=1 Tax=Candidatus Nomurabacteria bacterium RIFCSPLOWO2_02_FULL_40_67 TaxID=1801787 RepID=A0A1F6Y7D4_9BACT|nr:MAG: hypothetical protein UU66_C0026G0006 [Parcubacteria group bacterium GW2011_GWB1_41_5]KKS70929.1 MAG: hypothetical protein UV43_C0049G0010 [Parcubacteria group bacterium GW2011_GWF2_42_7]OGI62143.1 MAG: hypothetical protein A2W12_00885 [Candidatus Nomurabacteria bacterium RBG_16_40_11]OGI70567.1 MAG: hypothetical protein A2643_01835 [Candidatus Nomurabacteria bacterium RIFCSPHIGHO2_01_FULL_39_220]OGI72013.1 MAG: hypothetical protein A2W56_03225 [Candidatus Nomurabacteria bacterium RIFCSP